MTDDTLAPPPPSSPLVDSVDATSSTSTLAPPTTTSAWLYLMIGFMVGAALLGAVWGGYHLYLKYWLKSDDSGGGDDEDGRGKRDGKGGKGGKVNKGAVTSNAFTNSPLNLGSGPAASVKSRGDMSWPPPTSSRITSTFSPTNQSTTIGDSVIGRPDPANKPALKSPKGKK